MSDQNSGPLSISFNIADVKTGRPIIHDGATVRIRFAGLQETSNDNGKMLVPEVHLLEKTTDVDGKDINPGFSVRDRITLYDKNTPPDKYPDRAVQRICQIVDAFLNTGDPGNKKERPSRPDFNAETVALMIGKEAYIKVKAKVGGEYEGNDIVKYISTLDMTA